MNIPEFADKRDLFKFLKENKDVLIAEKKYSVKHADAMVYVPTTSTQKEGVDKALSPLELIDLGTMNIKAVINTTNLMDSHSDVHIPGLWNKSVKEQKNLYLLEEHRMTFKGIISDEVTASTKKMKWSSLGFDFDGSTEALIFDVKAHIDRNPYMYEQYAKGRVKNHSVGMRYVNIYLCVDSEENYWVDEKKNWDKYIDQVANRDAAEEQGFFWAVTEAKVVEGSAVPIGSNIATPTMSVSEDKEAVIDTSKAEPTQVTQPEDLNIVKLNFN